MSKKTSKQASNGYKPTSAAEWRRPRQEGELVLLPSGNWARLRPADLLQMVKAGHIPDTLSPIAAKATWAEQDPAAIGASYEIANQYDELFGIVLPAIFLEPKIALPGEAPKEDEILLEDVELADRTAAFNLAVMGASAMRKFREQQEKSLAALRNGDENA